ncbi:MAG: DUF6935 domain-containing protein [Lachnospiraceae bacterium]
MKTERFVFEHLPKTVEELRGMAEAGLESPFATAALSVAAFCRYRESPEDAFAMIDFLKGPQPLSNYDRQFLKERLAGKTYKPFSFFEGSSPANNYEPAKPYVIEVFDGPYSYQNEGYATLWLRSSGADSLRPVTLRRKGNQWFLWTISYLSDIRTSAAEDPWV